MISFKIPKFILFHFGLDFVFRVFCCFDAKGRNYLFVINHFWRKRKMLIMIIISGIHSFLIWKSGLVLRCNHSSIRLQRTNVCSNTKSLISNHSKILRKLCTWYMNQSERRYSTAAGFAIYTQPSRVQIWLRENARLQKSLKLNIVWCQHKQKKVKKIVSDKVIFRS